MPETKLTGRGGKGRGQGRKTNHERGIPDKQSAVLSVRVSPDVAEWIKANGGNKFHADLLRKAFIESLIV
jgi:hypothetical protein